MATSRQITWHLCTPAQAGFDLRGGNASVTGQHRISNNSTLRKVRASHFIGLVAALALGPAEIYGQGSAQRATAIRIQGRAPAVDGVLDDPAWQTAPPITDFTARTPVEGEEPSSATEVRFLYDDAALYVAARMYRDDPSKIEVALTRRDERSGERIIISLDTYLDRRTAYSFSVTSSGVRGDWYHPRDEEVRDREMQFNPVWLARAKVDSLGWAAEMRVPFSQLRFTSAEEQVWGLNIDRFIPDRNEDIFWVMVPRALNGWSSRFGTLHGISGITPARGIELIPYTAGDLTFRSDLDPRDPFDDKTAGRVGADMKLGVGSNLTLDATVNPDFGQVEADPAEVNLSAFETFFDERRPFFIEGNELLTGRGASFLGRPTYYYSRRIGASPHGEAAGHYVRTPSNSTILGAAKLSGRLASGLSVGALTSVTAREYARTNDTLLNRFTDVQVEPVTGFGIVRVQQEVGSDRSVVGGTVTAVRRAFGGGSLQNELVRAAYAGGTDWQIRFQEGKYELTGWAGFSRLEGDPAALDELQQSSRHYYQRPDQDHVSLGTRNALTGWTASVRGDKNAGRFTLWGIQVSAKSPGFEINDFGRMNSADAVDFNADIQLRDTQPSKLLRSYRFGFVIRSGWNFGGIRQYTHFIQSSRLDFHNFWNLTARTTIRTRALSDSLTRGGPLMGTGSGWNTSLSLGNFFAAATSWDVDAEYGRDELGGWRYDLGASLKFRVGTRWAVEIEPRYVRSVNARQYIQDEAGGSALTFGSRYVFAFIERSRLSAQIRLNYAFTPDLTLEAYAEPFAASGRFSDFGELEAAQSRSLRTYGTDGTTIARQTDGSYTVTDGADSFTIDNLDFNNLSFRSNLVLRWEFLPGSTLFAIWQQDRGEDRTISDLIRPRDLWDSLGASGDNFFAMKIAYWFSIH